MIRTLLHFFKPHLRLFGLDMFCAVMVAAVDLAFPMVSRHAMYRLLPDRLFRTFFLLMAVVIFLVVRAINKLHKPKEAPVTTKICPYCKSEIDKDATRCKCCTSELPAEE